MYANDNAFCNATTMEAPWNDGTDEHNTIWCTDCHRTDNANGPHGFDTVTDNTLTVWGGLTTITTPEEYTPLCIKCHKYTVYGDGVDGSRFDHGTGQHKQPQGCLLCHYGTAGSMVGVHGAEHAQWFMNGTGMNGWQPFERTGAGNDKWGRCWSDGGSCGGHADRSY
jgi:hypothetical protein